MLMKNSHLLRVMEEANLSPELMADRLGISGMTLRRWRQTPPAGKLPELYERALVDVVGDLMAEGHLAPDSPAGLAVMKESSFTPAASGSFMGITADMLEEKTGPSHGLIEGLANIGGNQSRQAVVIKSERKLEGLRKMGAEWKRRISLLWKVLSSAELNTFDKLVAYGALFYLIMPFDHITDTIPVIGYMDDFIILGLAVTYYMKRFPQLLD